MEQILKEYEDYLRTAEYEVIRTPKLGWIILWTDYHCCSDPVRQLHTPDELRAYIEFQISISE